MSIFSNIFAKYYPQKAIFSILTYYFARYGVRVPTEECPAAVIVMSCQCIVGVIIQVTGVRQISFTRFVIHYVVLSSLGTQRFGLVWQRI